MADQKQLLETNVKNAIAEAMRMKQQIRNYAATAAHDVFRTFVEVNGKDLDVVSTAEKELLPLAEKYQKLYEWVMFGSEDKTKQESKMEPIVVAPVEAK